MTLLLMFGLATGAILAFAQFKVFTLLPVILLCGAVAFANCFATGLDPPTIALGLLVAIASPQIGYLAAAIGTRYTIAEYLRVRANNRLPALRHAMQTEIGQGLRTTFELPRDLPQEIAALLARMK
jgi:hypothetical protein